MTTPIPGAARLRKALPLAPALLPALLPVLLATLLAVPAQAGGLRGCIYNNTPRPQSGQITNANEIYGFGVDPGGVTCKELDSGEYLVRTYDGLRRVRITASDFSSFDYQGTRLHWLVIFN